MYSDSQYQAYYPSTYAFGPALEHPGSLYPPSKHQSHPIQLQLYEAAPPYSEADFHTHTQHVYRNEQLPYTSSSQLGQRNQPTSFERSLFEPPYPVEKNEHFPEKNPFQRTPKTAYHQANLSNDFSHLQLRDIRNQIEYSPSDPASSSRRSPLPPVSQHHDFGYFQKQPYQGTPPLASNDSSDTLSDQQILDQALSFYKQVSALPPNISSLPLLIAIPQTIPGGGQAFTRAWVPSLSAHGITQNEFLTFIDGLNIVSTASPPLQVLNLAGNLVGMIPHHIATVAGFAMQTTAQLGTVAVGKGRTEMYMKESNEKFFGPRKLKVAIASREAVGAVLGMPKGGPVLAPLTKDTISMGMVERSVAMMKGFAAELDFNVPPPAEQTTMLAKISAKQIERQVKKNEKKMLKEREKALENEEKESADILEREEKEKGRQRKDNNSNGESKGEKGQKSRRELKREESRERKERRKERKADREAEKKHGKKGKDKEAEKAAKLLWILMENI
jgi:hypothetical protein